MIKKLPQHKDTYFFEYGIDIEKPIELANKIIDLQQENQSLKEQLEASEKARKEAMELKHKFHKDFGLLIFENYELIKFMNKLEDILDIDKGE